MYEFAKLCWGASLFFEFCALLRLLTWRANLPWFLTFVLFDLARWIPAYIVKMSNNFAADPSAAALYRSIVAGTMPIATALLAGAVAEACARRGWKAAGAAGLALALSMLPTGWRLPWLPGEFAVALLCACAAALCWRRHRALFVLLTGSEAIGGAAVLLGAFKVREVFEFEMLCAAAVWALWFVLADLIARESRQA